MQHEDYEILCALAATGQISRPELEDLRRHCDTCPTCGDRLFEWIEVHEELLLNTEPQLKNLRVPSGMQDRFITRAASEGLPLTKISPVLLKQSPLFGASVAAMTVLLFMFALHVFVPAEKSGVGSVAQTASVTHENSKLRAIESSQGVTAKKTRPFSPRRHPLRMVHSVESTFDGAVNPVEALTANNRFHFYLPSSIHQSPTYIEGILKKPSAASLLASLSSRRIQSYDEGDFLSLHPPPVHTLRFSSSVPPENKLFRYNPFSIASLQSPQLPGPTESTPFGFRPGIRPLQFQKSTEQ